MPHPLKMTCQIPHLQDLATTPALLSSILASLPSLIYLGRMEKKSTTARQKTSQEETGISTRAAKKRNTTIATGKAQKRAKLSRTKKKSATKEHGGDEYSPENVVQEGGRI